ncbi:CapA family protein [Clostridium oryzae]|uniref:Capsule biosynthesis protein CapA n=1 Tax=Clostridium oryzae TaxID=1450648 RepID=A0A1V4IGG2_9CLOT|nr:CapA family protein [Clostridium oryzae]OPJ59009.1 capsule biosynthesis protein CapA [Clostridium oryzae]
MSNFKSPKFKYVILLLSLILLLISCTTLYIYIRTNSYKKTHSISSNLTTSNSIKNTKAHAKSNFIAKTGVNKLEHKALPKTTKITISAVGDCTIGTDPKFNQSTSLPAVVKRNGNSKYYLFKNVRSIFRKDNITIANLETTFTTSNNRQIKKFTFKGNPAFAASIPTASIDGVNISNNHIHDFGVQGFKDTISTLKKFKIPYFGEGNVWETKYKNIRIAFLGYTGWSNSPSFLRKLTSDIRKYKSREDIVIVTFHWGIERTYTPNSTQRSIAHTAIDAGATLVIGHHPHVLQSVEQYKGKYICYSLGNFCFGGNSNPPDKDTMIFQTRLTFKDKKLITNKIRVIPCSISSVSGYNNYCPTPLSGYNKKRVLSKINRLNIHMKFKLGTKFK